MKWTLQASFWLSDPCTTLVCKQELSHWRFSQNMSVAFTTLWLDEPLNCRWETSPTPELCLREYTSAQLKLNLQKQAATLKAERHQCWVKVPISFFPQLISHKAWTLDLFSQSSLAPVWKEWLQRIKASFVYLLGLVHPRKGSYSGTSFQKCCVLHDWSNIQASYNKQATGYK